MNKDLFDRCYERIENLEKANPKAFNIIGHIILISCVIGNIIAFFYAINN